MYKARGYYCRWAILSEENWLGFVRIWFRSLNTKGQFKKNAVKEEISDEVKDSEKCIWFDSVSKYLTLGMNVSYTQLKHKYYKNTTYDRCIRSVSKSYRICKHIETTILHQLHYTWPHYQTRVQATSLTKTRRRPQNPFYGTSSLTRTTTVKLQHKPVPRNRHPNSTVEQNWRTPTAISREWHSYLYYIASSVVAFE